MGIFNMAFRSEGTPDNTVARVGGGLFDFLGFGGNPGATLAGPKTSLTLPAFYNGINIIAGDIAMLPKHIFKKDGERREKYTDHPAYRLISSRPSDLMNAFDFWKIIRISTILKGNGFAEIMRNGAGYPIELRYIASDEITILESDNKLFYQYKGRTISGENMLHFKGFSLDGKRGIGVVTFAAAQLGVYLDSQLFASEIYKNKGLTFGVVETEKALKPEIKKQIQEGVSSALSRKSPFRVAMLDEGFQYKQIAITPAEAQFLETNKQAVHEIARWLNLAPHKLKDLGESNYSNIYQQSIEHVQHTLLPWVISDEQELNNKLFSEAEQGTVYTKFNISFLLRGDLDMKQKFYTSMIYAGVYTRNEVRALEDMNPIEGLDEPLQPVNMQALSQLNENMKNLKDDKNNT